MHSKNFSTGQDIPLGLSMAMAQYPLAYDSFARLTPQQRQQLIDSTRKLRPDETLMQFGNSVIGSESTL